MSLTLREERPEDTRKIRALVTAAFGQPEEADLVDALRTANDLVAPDRQGGGIGGALIREAIARANATGETLLFVLGDPAYYSRFGFSTATAAPFDCVYAGEYFMALELNTEKADPAEVIYADAFGDLG